MFRKERNKYINKYKNDPISQETLFYKNTNEKMDCISKEYIQYCDKTVNISSIDTFFDNNWYNEYNSIIDDLNIDDYIQVKDLLIKLNEFKIILKIHKNVDINDTLLIEDNLKNCITKRIQYKYKCINKENRDIGHDAENLKQIFHYSKLKDLKELFIKIKKKRIELKEELLKRKITEEKRKITEEKRKVKEEKRITEFLKIDLEIDKNEQITERSLSSSEFIPVVKKKKNSRKKH